MCHFYMRSTVAISDEGALSQFAQNSIVPVPISHWQRSSVAIHAAGPNPHSVAPPRAIGDADEVLSNNPLRDAKDSKVLRLISF